MLTRDHTSQVNLVESLVHSLSSNISRFMELRKLQPPTGWKSEAVDVGIGHDETMRLASWHLMLRQVWRSTYHFLCVGDLHTCVMWPNQPQVMLLDPLLLCIFGSVTTEGRVTGWREREHCWEGCILWRSKEQKSMNWINDVEKYAEWEFWVWIG